MTLALAAHLMGIQNVTSVVFGTFTLSCVPLTLATQSPASRGVQGRGGGPLARLPPELTNGPSAAE